MQAPQWYIGLLLPTSSPRPPGRTCQAVWETAILICTIQTCDVSGVTQPTNGSQFGTNCAADSHRTVVHTGLPNRRLLRVAVMWRSVDNVRPDRDQTPRAWWRLTLSLRPFGPDGRLCVSSDGDGLLCLNASDATA